jgi:hypothetical protein
MTTPVYPAGLALCTVSGTLAFGTGTLRVEAERKFGYTGSNWVMPRYFSRNSSYGVISVQLPFSDAAGRLGDFGAPLTDVVGYKLTFQPAADTSVQTIGYVTLLTAGGANRNLFSLTDLGAWPNQTKVVTAPGSGASTWVQDPNNPLLAYLTTDGTF